MKHGNKITDQEIEYARNVPIHHIIGISQVKRTSIRCPMPNHNDKTPSFLLDAENGYHCFACGVHGNNAIDFCQDLDPGSSFTEIVKYLNNKY